MACLSELKIGELTLTPEFGSKTYEYTVETTDDENIITATAINEDAKVNIIVNNEVIENNTAYTWNTGDNIIEITVTDGSQSKTYTATVTKV